MAEGRLKAREIENLKFLQILLIFLSFVILCSMSDRMIPRIVDRQPMGMADADICIINKISASDNNRSSTVLAVEY